jgi:7-carboxy-7-deazaguanine synthase (Cx14CxxC type)
MRYRVKEIVYTLQGEGALSGTAAVFLRFTGCNLWSGREADRDRAICPFCDTDFLGTDGPGGGSFDSPTALAAAVAAAFPTASHHALRWVVATGGEPLLQIDEPLLDALHNAGLRVAVETNGTVPAPAGIDWLCVSPKANSTLVQQEGDELKLVYPQANLLPEAVDNLRFRHFFLQPLDGPKRDENLQLAAKYCLAHPQWRLSLQMHKIVGLP